MEYALNGGVVALLLVCFVGSVVYGDRRRLREQRRRLRQQNQHELDTARINMLAVFESAGVVFSEDNQCKAQLSIKLYQAVEGDRHKFMELAAGIPLTPAGAAAYYNMCRSGNEHNS